MFQKSGAILGSEFLEYEEFKQKLLSSLKEREKSGVFNITYLKNLLTQCENSSGKKFYDNWKRFQRYFTKTIENNDITVPTSLLVIEHIENQQAKSVTFKRDENQSLTKAGRYSRKTQMDKLDKQISEKYFQGLFDKHFEDFKKELFKREKSERFLTNIFHQKAQIKEQRGALIGHIADAYIQHALAKHNPVSDLEDTQSVFKEESLKQIHDRLVESKNSTSLITGGDFILIDANNRIIHNIQLKVSLNKYRSQIITTQQTKTQLAFVREILTEMEMSKNLEYEKLIEYYYKMISTTAWVSEEKLEQITDQYLISSSNK